MCSGAIIVGGDNISLVDFYFIYEKEEDSEEEDIIETEQEKYLKFINKDYETFIDIYKEKRKTVLPTKPKSLLVN